MERSGALPVWDLADDLHRFLNNEPILARPIGLGGRTAKWVKRRPALAGLLGVSGLAVLGLLTLGILWSRA